MNTPFTAVLYSSIEDYKGVLTTTFPRPIELQGKWEVAITGIWGVTTIDSCALWIMSDAVDYSHLVNNVPMQIIEMIKPGVSGYKVKRYYSPVARNRLESINIYLKSKPFDDDCLQASDFRSNDLACALHFRKA